MINISNYFAILLSVLAAAVYGIVSWKMSGEKFSETKLARTILVALAASLSITISGTAPDVYVNSFASTMISLVVSKVAGTVKPVTPEQTQTVETVINATLPEVTESQPEVSAPVPVSEVAVEAIKAEVEVEPPEVNVEEVNRANAKARTRATGANAGATATP